MGSDCSSFSRAIEWVDISAPRSGAGDGGVLRPLEVMGPGTEL